MGTNGSEEFKPLLLQIIGESFQTFPELSSHWSSTFGIFEILKIETLMIFFSF